MTDQEAVKNAQINAVEDMLFDIERDVDKPEKMSESIYREIKNEILCCALKPGTSISESSLARQYNVSRTPVREALARLIQEELIQISASGGYSVTPITVKDVHDVFALRVLLEGEAAELAASKPNQDTVDKLNNILLTLDQIDTSSVDYEGRLEYVQLGSQFHLSIAEASGNRKLLKIITSLMEAASRYVYIESSVVGTMGVEESRELVLAIEKQDSEKARKIMESHVLASYQRTKDALLSGNDVPLLVGN
jgi:DNA-binding GntR family transcriptional regulator